MRSKVAQRGENSLVVRVIRAELNAIAFGYADRDFQRIDRVQSQSLAKKWGVRVDVGWFHVETQRRDNGLRQICCYFGNIVLGRHKAEL